MQRTTLFRRDMRGTAAVEFAFVAPLFIVLTFGIIVFGAVISTYNNIQQLAAESARAALGGTSDAERDQLARNSVTSTLPSYPFITAAKLTVATTPGQSPHTFMVSLTYDMTGMFAFGLGGWVPLPNTRLTRSAVVLVVDS